MQKIPSYIKTDTEINHGNSGGAVFDKDNRYVGISSAISKDDGGKISLIINWNKINLYLNHLVFKGDLSLPDKQYVKRDIPSSEQDLWAGIHDYFRGDYSAAVDSLQKYTAAHTSDGRGLNYLCTTYLSKGDLDKMEKCAEQLRSLYPKATAFSWELTSIYNDGKENDSNKAYDSIKKAINLNPDFVLLLNQEADLELKLNKNDEAQKTATKILQIDETNSDAWYDLGQLALKNQDYDNGLKYLELSFDTKPKASTAIYLAQLYDDKYKNSQAVDDTTKALIFRIEALTLDPKNIDNLTSLAGSVSTIFESDKNQSWGKSLKTIQNILQTLEVDQSLIDPIGGVTDDDIRQFLKKNQTVDAQITQKEIDAMRYIIKMAMAWMYTFTGDKNSCSNEFADIGRSDVLKILIDAGATPDNIKNVLSRNIILNCLCTSDDYSSDVMNACFATKLNTTFNK